MSSVKKLTVFFSVLFISFFLTACSPEIGSEKWCASIKEKPKGELTANEVSDFAKHCLL